MTDGVLTAEARLELELETQIAMWREMAVRLHRHPELGFNKNFRGLGREACADELEALLSRWRSAHGSREAEPKIAHARIDNERQVVYCTNCNATLYKMVRAKPRPFHLEDDDAAHGSEQEGPT